jgi:hypothetical protein
MNNQSKPMNFNDVLSQAGNSSSLQIVTTNLQNLVTALNALNMALSNVLGDVASG